MIASLLAAALLQQTPAEAAMTACLGKPDAERLACFDAAAAMLDSEPPLGVLERPGTDAAPMEAPRPPVIGARAEAAPPRTVPATKPAPEPLARTSAPDTAEPDPAEPASDFGLPERRDRNEALTLPVQSIALNRYGRATVTLADGQVWRQLGSDGAKVSRGAARRAETATIKRAALGSYRMTVEPSGRTIRVERVR